MRSPFVILGAFVAIAGIGAAMFFFTAAPSDDAPTGPAPKPPNEVDARWTDDASAYRGELDTVVSFHCPPAGRPGSVWGTDVYTDDSSVCTAAVHMGLIGMTEGGTVRIQIGPAKEGFQGSPRNAVSSSDYGAWGGSFTFVR